MNLNQPSPFFIRPATLNDAASIARVHVDSWLTTYRGLISDEYLRSLTYEERTARWIKTLRRQDSTEATYVALDSNSQVIGFAYGGPERQGSKTYQGELYAIYLLAEAQRSGLGKQLLIAIARHLAQQGMTSMLIWVLAENSARHFYEAMGGKCVRLKMEAIGGEMCKELGYGWKNLDALLQ